MVAESEVAAFGENLVIAGTAQGQGGTRRIGFAQQAQGTAAGGVLPLQAGAVAGRYGQPVEAVAQARDGALNIARGA